MCQLQTYVQSQAHCVMAVLPYFSCLKTTSYLTCLTILCNSENEICSLAASQCKVSNY